MRIDKILGLIDLRVILQIDHTKWQPIWNDLARINEMLRVGTINITIPIDANIRVDVGLTR